MEKKDIASYSFEELQEEMLAIGEKGFRSRQIYSWIHEKLVDDFEEMTNLPKDVYKRQLQKQSSRRSTRWICVKNCKKGTVLF